MISVSIHPGNVWKTPENKIVKTAMKVTLTGCVEVEL
jgi:hypothetical protein